jgi:hypothetical protein
MTRGNPAEWLPDASSKDTPPIVQQTAFSSASHYRTVLGVIVLNKRLPGNDILTATVACTVILSIVAHGITANPMVKALGPRLDGNSHSP